MKRSLALFAALVLSTLPLAAFPAEGLASWYGGKFQGRRTANGEIFDTNKFTAAHKTLPFNTLVKVFNLDTGRSVIVRINDRGPFVEGRIIDLSKAAADAIGLSGMGVSRVRIEAVGRAGGELGPGARAGGGLPAPAARPASKPAPAAAKSGLVTVQVGAFGRADNADILKSALEATGLYPVLESGTGVTRVLLKNVESSGLTELRAKLKGAGVASILVMTGR